jgi:hypothetical protein
VLRFDLAGTGHQRATLVVYDVQGRRIRTLIDGRALPPGEYEVRWDGRGDAGERVPAGVYFYRLVTPTVDEARKMVLLH